MNLQGRHLAARLAAALALFLAAAAPATEVYRWTDADGKVHFGDKPPASGADQIPVRAAGGSQVDTTRQQRTRRLLQEFETERAERQASAAEQARTDAERAAACEDARNRHFEYQNSGYLYIWDENGEKRVLSDAQHQEARAEARADVDKWCD